MPGCGHSDNKERFDKKKSRELDTTTAFIIGSDLEAKAISNT
jgi:hypothetical protein